MEGGRLYVCRLRSHLRRVRLLRLPVLLNRLLRLIDRLVLLLSSVCGLLVLRSLMLATGRRNEQTLDGIVHDDLDLAALLSIFFPRGVGQVSVDDRTGSALHELWLEIAELTIGQEDYHVEKVRNVIVSSLCVLARAVPAYAETCNVCAALSCGELCITGDVALD